jgi:hypothetical protein
VACLAVVLGPAGLAGLRRMITPGAAYPLVVKRSALIVLAIDQLLLTT